MNQIFPALLRSLRRPKFLAACLILLVAAVGLNASVSFLKLHFKKVPVELTRPLALIPERIGPWVQISQNATLDPEMLDVLGTDKYLFRTYADTRIAGNDIAEQFKDLTPMQRYQKEWELRKINPGAVVNFAVTYYTGMVDTVAHVPDRCYVADGYEPSQFEEVDWRIIRPAGASITDPLQPVRVRYINFEDQSGTGKISRSVSYFFKVNNQYESGPLGVRRRLADLGEKFGYYCKIETMTLMNDHPASARVQTDFLTHAMPEVEKCMPDWEKVHRDAQASAAK